MRVAGSHFSRTQYLLALQEDCKLYTIDSRHFSACFNRTLGLS